MVHEYIQNCQPILNCILLFYKLFHLIVKCNPRICELLLLNIYMHEELVVHKAKLQFQRSMLFILHAVNLSVKIFYPFDGTEFTNVSEQPRLQIGRVNLGITLRVFKSQSGITQFNDFGDIKFIEI